MERTEMEQDRTVLVVGASRGLGLALAAEWCVRGWHVVATVRTPSKQLEALRSHHPGRLEVETADILDPGSVEALRGRLDGRRMDVLFINAGIARSIEETPATLPDADFADMMRTNALAPVRAIEILECLVGSDGVVAVMSSELASIAQNDNPAWQGYAASKAALNMLMKGYATRHPGDPRALLLLAPGWVRTEMGGSDAALSIEESIPHVVDTVDANRGRPGLRYLDRFNTALPW
jgi:NAD(P)-dependent dehydrogenase (short-subunit alcohol dehydrogenase family)